MSLVTYKGIKFIYPNPTPEMIDIDDIVQSLTRINRFVGHSKRAYSVAEHSIYCYEMAKKLGYSNRECLLTLIHDFTEAYVGDCPAPLKELLPKFSSNLNLKSRRQFVNILESNRRLPKNIKKLNALI
ncbi:HD domain-containing protein [Bacillus licheniformis]|uniref:HD domain-containing protein n=1 Tax=Bacillus licheniformis TaxID=1402 RepID=UPI003BF67225